MYAWIRVLAWLLACCMSSVNREVFGDLLRA